MEKSLVNHCHKQNTIGCDENIDFIDTEEHMKTVIIGIAGGIRFWKIHIYKPFKGRI